MKNLINIIFAVILVLGTLFLYGAFKNLDSLNDKEIIPDSQTEIVNGGKETYIQNKIDNWLDYKNDEYGFSLQYPEGWEAQDVLKPQNPEALHEIDLHQKEYYVTRAYLTIQIFENNENLNVFGWWNEWLSAEDKKEADCQAEYKGEAPCLYLRGMLEKEDKSEIYGLDTKVVQLFQFDSSRECNYIAYGKYIYGICYDVINSNDSNFEANRKTTSEMFSTFIFNDLVSGEVFGEKDFRENIIGNWGSITDLKNSLVLTEDGIIKNLYDGKVMDSGTWVLDGSSLKVTIDKEEVEYTVVFAGKERLELTFLPRGNTLHFMRVVE